MKTAPQSKRRKISLYIAIAFIALGACLASFLPQALAEQVNSYQTSVGKSGTSITCILNQPSQKDEAFVGITSNVAVAASSPVTDGSGNTYTQQKAASIAGTSTQSAAFAYIYSAPLNTVPAAGGTLTITVTFTSSSTASGGICLDTVGPGGTAAHSSSATGTASGNGTNPFTASVPTFTPSNGNFLMSVVAGSTCSTLSSVTAPGNAPQGPKQPAGAWPNVENGGNLLSSCNFTGSKNAEGFGLTTWFLQSNGTATVQAYTVTSASTISGCHHTAATCPGGVTSFQPSIGWAEVAADFPMNTIKSVTTLGETQTLTQQVTTAVSTEAETQTLTQAVTTAASTVGETQTIHVNNAINPPTAGESQSEGQTNWPNGVGGTQNPSITNLQQECIIVSYLGTNTTNSCAIVGGSITLVASASLVPVGTTVILTATASVFVVGPYFIKIFATQNSTTSALATCVGVTCVLPVTVKHASTQYFQAAITKTGALHGSVANSTLVQVTWGSPANFAYITFQTSPLSLKNALTINGILQYNTPYVLPVIKGTMITLAAATTALGPQLNTFTFSSWSDGGAQSHTITANGNATYTARYSTSPACTSTNTETLLNTGCEWGVVFYTWFSIFGPWMLAFLSFLPALAIYLRTESPAAATGVYTLIAVIFTGGLLVASLPATLNTVAPGLLGVVIAGSVFQLIRSNKGG